VHKRFKKKMKYSVSCLALAACLLFHPAMADEEKRVEYNRCTQEADARLDDCRNQNGIDPNDPGKSETQEKSCVERWERDITDCGRTYKG